MPPQEMIGAWVAVGLTLCLFSFLYEDNPLYKFGEHLYLGVSVGYGIAFVIWKTMIPKWYEPLFSGHPDWTLLIPTAIGLMFLARIVPKLAWVSRWPMAALMGYGAGVAIPVTVNSVIFQQAQGTVKPLLRMTPTGAVDASPGAIWADVSTFLILLGVLSVLVYFFFSVDRKGPVKAVSKIGIVFLMIYFGASYGNTVQGRFALLYGRFADLATYADGSFGYATWVLAGVLIAVLLGMRLKRREA